MMDNEPSDIPPDDKQPEAPLQFPKIQGLGETRNGQSKKRETPTCSDCVFFNVNLQNIKTGFCHGNPPQFLLNQRDGNVMVLRPQVRSVDIACRFLSLAK